MPQAYHELTAVADIPDSIMEKIQGFQKKGALSNFQEQIEGISSLRDQAYTILKECEIELLKEEDQDKQMRETFVEKWTNVSSLIINASYKQ